MLCVLAIIGLAALYAFNSAARTEPSLLGSEVKTLGRYYTFEGAHVSIGYGGPHFRPLDPPVRNLDYLGETTELSQDTVADALMFAAARVRDCLDRFERLSASPGTGSKAELYWKIECDLRVEKHIEAELKRLVRPSDRTTKSA